MTKSQLMKALEGVKDNERIHISIEGLEDVYSIDKISITPLGKVYLYCEDYPSLEEVSHLCDYVYNMERDNLSEEWGDALATISDLPIDEEELI